MTASPAESATRIRGRVQLNKTMVLARVERQHALIEALRARAPGRITGAQLANRLGISKRTVERDATDLVEAGVPITVSRGSRGGYAIDARAQLPPITLTPGEAAAIIASMVAVGPYVAATAESALHKVISAFRPYTSARRTRRDQMPP